MMTTQAQLLWRLFSVSGLTGRTIYPTVVVAWLPVSTMVRFLLSSIWNVVTEQLSSRATTRLVVVGGIANDGIDGNEMAEDDSVVVEVVHEVADVVFVVHTLLTKLLPGADHGLLQPWAALFEGDV